VIAKINFYPKKQLFKLFLIFSLPMTLIKKYKSFIYLSLILTFITALPASASGGIVETHNGAAITFLWIAIVLIFAKLSSSIEKLGQPSVLGELLVGVVLGNLTLIGINYFEPITTNSIIIFLAKLGVVILMFQIGLDSNITKMRQVGKRAFLVAMIGIIAPFILGTFIIGPLILPGLSFNAYLFLGTILTTTSVSITAYIFRGLGKVQTPEARIILGAAVIDDVLGLIILAIVTALVTGHTISFTSISFTVIKAIGFLVGSIFLGQLLAPKIGQLFSKIQKGVGMKFTLAISFALIFAYFAEIIGLAPIIGAFAAGLMLDPVHFRYFKDPKVITDVKNALHGAGAKTKQRVLDSIEPHAKRHIEDIIEPIGLFLTPIFFVLTGMAVNLDALFNLKFILLAVGIAVAAIGGKLLAGLAAGKTDKWIVSWGMVPRGEVGLIFATLGKTLGVINNEIFSVIIMVFILTTFITPPILTHLLKKKQLS